MPEKWNYIRKTLKKKVYFYYIKNKIICKYTKNDYNMIKMLENKNNFEGIYECKIFKMKPRILIKLKGIRQENILYYLLIITAMGKLKCLIEKKKKSYNSNNIH